MVMSRDLASVFSGRRVLITGHTGFKGSWLTMWLERLGAQVHGFALEPASQPALFDLAHIRVGMASHIPGDVRDPASVQKALAATQPEVVFHLAAQPLVRASYRDPLGTWSTNVMGTANLLEAVRHCPSVRAVVIVTTDKCYENREWEWGYRESDALGGFDAYSASKAGAELVAASYRRAFFAEQDVLVATARAGNVIGGGDWAEDRLIPDAARAVAGGKTLRIRHPAATRPWQHVLESLHGYLLLAAGLLAGRRELADAFNFGPDVAGNSSVAEVLRGLQAHWPELAWEADAPAKSTVPHEATFLYLDAAKARRVLEWKPRWNLSATLEATAHWYRAILTNPARARALCEDQLEQYGA
jgi:CDP-glucose 4,6-dehydratase